MPWRSLEDALAIGYGVERAFVCHVHPDTNASASVNSVNGMWICYACGAKGKVDPDKIELAPDTVVREVNKALRFLEGNEREYYPESWYSQFDAAGPGRYWLERFSLPVCQQFRLGYDPFSDAAVYPLRDAKGRILGAVQRNLHDTGPKYYYPPGVDITCHLFNYHACEGDQIFLVEGATDAIAVAEVGGEAMALYGSRLSRTQANLLRKYYPSQILVATDMDDAGDAAYQAVRAQLAHTFDVRRVRWDGYKDLAEMPVETREVIVREALAQGREDKVASKPCESVEQSRAASPLLSSTPSRVRLSIRRSTTSQRRKPD